MMTYTDKEFFRKDGSVDTDKAIQAGRHARSAAILQFCGLLLSAAKAATRIFEIRRA